jgi:hypothetical protein
LIRYLGGLRQRVEVHEFMSLDGVVQGPGKLGLMMEPITLGGGKTLFPTDGEARAFKLISTTAGTECRSAVTSQRADQSDH